MKHKSALIFFLMLAAITAYPQGQPHRWKALLISESQKLWYDASQLEAVSNATFDIWVLELHQPMIEVNGVGGKIMRTKTLYQINTDIARYNIKKVVYFNAANDELASFNYNLENVDDNIKYYFPIYPDSFILKLIRELKDVQSTRAKIQK